MYSNYRPLTVLSPSIVQLVTPTPTTTSAKSTKTSTSFRTTTLPTELLLPSSVSKTTKSSTTFESSELFTSSYTSSEPSSTSNFLDYKKSSNNLALGLGLGIPIGLFFITLITLGSWYYFKQKKKTNKPILPSHKEFNTSFKNPYIGPFSEEAGTKQESSERRYEKEYAERGYGKDYQKDYSKDFDKYDASFNEKITTPVRFMSVPQKIKRESVALYHRFSKIGKIEEESNSISPMFLKRFNLNKPFTPKTPKNQKVNIQGDGRVAGVYSNNSNAVSSKYSNFSQEPKPNKDKLLPKLPSLIKMENPVEDSKFKVIRTFKKNLSDEIDLKIGETVEILKIHRDDWCLIKNEFGGIGMAPKNCLEIVR
ncbi:hypothetical protein CLIB1444_03S10176 [[Candida] jaroonii]|uniref:Uncharacterized protein n=1 Tax=[Candida] jaroonii TaxID=467808 RepID=A0ACA9Y5S0_9ASCO|nr:hypothetical protein CLIB1444_03S10176 [[Candida] jaroonii]